MSTWKLITVLAKATGLQERDIGYANKAPIKIGHLKGNRFSIILHHIDEKDAKFFNTTAKMMQSKGIPNYYGYQRFGEDSRSYLQGKEIAHSGKKLRGSKEKLLVSAYQSHLFNKWLGQRVKLCFGKTTPNI